MKRTVLMLCAVVSILSCASITVSPGENISILMFPENLNLQEIDGSFSTKPIIVIDPPVNGQSIFVGDDRSIIRIENVAIGEYQVHPLHFPSDFDFTISIEEDGDNNFIYTLPQFGLEYFFFSQKTQDPLNKDERLAIISALDPEEMLSVSAPGFLPADNLIPLISRFDGLEDLFSVNELTSSNLVGEIEELILYANETEPIQIRAFLIKDMLESQGLVSFVDVYSFDWQSYLELMKTDQFDLGRSGWSLDSNNMLVFLEYLIDLISINSPAIEAELKQGWDSLYSDDLQGYVAAVTEVHDYILQEGFVIPVFFY
jgi:hypothetical protein